MATREQRYAAIAANMRCQQIPDLPLKHEWLELLTLLSHQDDDQLREYGITELRICADQATRNRHD